MMGATEQKTLLDELLEQVSVHTHARMHTNTPTLALTHTHMYMQNTLLKQVSTHAHLQNTQHYWMSCWNM